VTFKKQFIKEGTVSYEQEYWVGVSTSSTGTCIWLGIDSGQAGQACYTFPNCQLDVITYEVADYLAQQAIDHVVQGSPLSSDEYKIHYHFPGILKGVIAAAVIVVLAAIAPEAAIGAAAAITVGYFASELGSVIDSGTI
jgi:hypothetical protein